jgi:hypothetical protein
MNGSKSVMKRLAVQRPKPEPRFVQGFQDGSGLTSIRDLHAPSVDASRIEGATIAVCNWGCSCCQGEDTQERIMTAKRIVDALNFVRFIANDFAIDGSVESLRNRAREIVG